MTTPKAPTTRSPRRPAARVRVQYAACTLFCTDEMVCPLCRETVPANTLHECVRKENA